MPNENGEYKAIEDAIETGVVRGYPNPEADIHIPHFSKDSRIAHKRKYTADSDFIVSKPHTGLEWVRIDKFGNTVPEGGGGFTPIFHGEKNATPITYFDYFEPSALGWRFHRF